MNISPSKVKLKAVLENRYAFQRATCNNGHLSDLSSVHLLPHFMSNSNLIQKVDLEVADLRITAWRLKMVNFEV